MDRDQIHSNYWQSGKVPTMFNSTSTRLIESILTANKAEQELAQPFNGKRYFLGIF